MALDIGFLSLCLASSMLWGSYASISDNPRPYNRSYGGAKKFDVIVAEVG